MSSVACSTCRSKRASTYSALRSHCDPRVAFADTRLRAWQLDSKNPRVRKEWTQRSGPRKRGSSETVGKIEGREERRRRAWSPYAASPRNHGRIHLRQRPIKTLQLNGGVRRFVRTSLRNRIPVNREIFRVFRVSEGSLHGSGSPESEVGRQVGAGETRISPHPNREPNREGAGNDQGKEQGLGFAVQ